MRVSERIIVTDTSLRMESSRYRRDRSSGIKITTTNPLYTIHLVESSAVSDNTNVMLQGTEDQPAAIHQENKPVSQQEGKTAFQFEDTVQVKV